jgi:hypothetical protein
VSGADTLFVVNAADKKTDKEIKSDGGDIVRIGSEDANVYILTDKNKVFKYNAAYKTLSARTADIDGAKLAGLRVYNGNIYGLNPEAEQIIKYAALDGGFAAGANWVKTKGDAKLASGIDLTIDGNMYVLRNDGQVDKFRMGNKEAFALAAIDPALKNPAMIVTPADTSPLYILDKATNRIAEFDKTGKLLYQYDFENVDGEIQGFALSADEKTVYLIAKDKVYKAALK